MNRSASAVDAISPAFERMQRMLFRPFDLGRWLILGFLTFLQLLGEGGGYSGSGWNRSSRSAEAEQVFHDSVAWIGAHLALVAFLGFFLVLFLLALIVLFSWLSARGTFCYIDCVATDRVEVVRPWKEHGPLADSFFFWRLVFTLCAITGIILLALPIGLSIWSMVRAGEDLSIGRVLFGTGLMAFTVLAGILFLVAVLIIKVFLVDFVAPVQYVRRSRCSEAVRAVIALTKANPGQFILYLVLRLMFAILFGLAVVGVGCATCCIAFCCMIIPVIGQTFLQPYYLFVRAMPLYFLRGFGPEFDLFPPAVPAGGPSGPAMPGGSAMPGWRATEDGTELPEGPQPSRPWPWEAPADRSDSPPSAPHPPSKPEGDDPER